MKQKAALLILTVFLVLTACSSKQASNVQPANNGGEKPVQTEQAKDDGEQINLTLVTHSDWEGPITKALVPFHAQNQNIHVNVQYNPYPKLIESNEVLLSAKSTDIDIVTVDSPLTANYTVKGYLEPLDKWITEADKANWTAGAVSVGTYDSKLYSVPLNSSSVMLFYNKDLFDAKGIPYLSEKPEDRITWDELVDLAKQLTEGEQYGFSFDQVGRAYQILALVNGKGASALSEDGLSASGFTNSDAAVAALQTYSDFFNTWKISPRLKRAETLDYFLTGKAAIFLSNTAILPRLEEAGLNYGIAPHPNYEDGQAVTPTGSLNLGISRFSTKKDAAAKLIQFLTYGEGAQILFEESGQLPASVKLLAQIEQDSKYEDLPYSALRLAAYESNHTAVARPKTPGYLEWESNFNKTADDIMNGADPRQALDALATLVDSQLKKYAQTVK